MGKVKRSRQKYHLERAKSMNDLTTIEPKVTSVPDIDRLNSSMTQFAISDDLFGGLNVPINLNQSLPQDCRSEMSTKSSFKGFNLTKVEKREMRRSALIKKLDATHRTKQERGRWSRGKPTFNSNMQMLADALPSLDQLKKQNATPKAIAEVKQKSLQKVKVRQYNTMKDIETFKKVLNDPSYKADPTAAISSYIQEKIRKELLLEESEG